MESVVRQFDQAMNSSFPWAPLLVLVAGLVVTTIHEAGHAIAALATGQREIAVNIGSHGTIIDRRLGALRLRAGVFDVPWKPAGSVAFDGARATARDMAVIAAAGPAASIAGALVTGSLVTSFASGTFAELCALCTFGGFLVGFGNLVPLTMTRGTRRKPGARIETDGRQLTRAVRVMMELRGLTRRQLQA